MTHRERPIIFSAPMVRAILEGSKTQTRRVVKWPAWMQPHPEVFASDLRDGQEVWYVPGGDQPSKAMRCPYGQPGDRLWVRETFLHVTKMENECFVVDDDENYVEETWYRADRKAYSYHPDGSEESTEAIPWKPSIHMPRTASRITLEVTEVRVERLQDISHIDAMAEGCSTGSWTIAEGPRPDAPFGSNAVKRYRLLWESINGPGSWEANPSVWVVEFKRC